MTLVPLPLPRHPVFFALSLALVATLSGCTGWSGTKLNPFNWFSSEEVTTLDPTGGYPDVSKDPRELVAQVTSLEVKQTQGGAIVAATGLPPTQGWWGAELLAENKGQPVDGVVTYRFVVAWPAPGTPASKRAPNTTSREVTAAAFLSNARLLEVKTIVVIGATNQRSMRR